MYYVTKTYDHTLGLSACFRQWRAKSHCRFLHGYALSFKLTFAAEKLDENNWVLDFGGLKEVKAFLCETFDHRLIVAEDDPHRDRLEALGVGSFVFGQSNSVAANMLADVLVLPFVGCEGFAEHVFGWVDTWLLKTHGDACYPAHRTDKGSPRALRLVSVEVREHGGNSAIYEGANHRG